MKPQVHHSSGGTCSCSPATPIRASRSLPLHLYILPFVLLLSYKITAQSQSAAPERVQISLASSYNDPAWVGQRVTIYVELLSETFFAGPSRLSLPDIAGAVLYKPEERALVSSKTITGKTFSVQTHELSFYPQRAGEFVIPPFKVRFGVAGKPGEAAKEYSEQTEALNITAKMPPGAEHLSVLISATELKVTESWDPEPTDKITVGDAFKRSITFRAPDMPGMVFPSIDFPSTEGIKLYQERATVNDRINRGSLTGERTDRMTYLCEKPGNYTLPVIAIPWWDLNTKEMHKIILPAVNFEVLPGEKIASLEVENQNPSPAIPWKSLTGFIIILILSSLILYRFRKSIQHSITEWQTRRSESESAYFKKITQASAPAQTLNAITAWFARSELQHDNLSLSSFAAAQNDVELGKQLETLQCAIVSNNNDWNPEPLIQALKQTRRAALKQSALQARPSLKPLNP